LLAWLGWAAGWEAFRAFDTCWWHPPFEQPPGRWRYSTPPPQRLEHFLDLARQVVPAGSRVAFSSPATRGNAPLFRFWWATYWLAEYTVIPADPPRLEPVAPPVDFRLTYGLRLDDPRCELVMEDWSGAVYRERGER
jgi:hypothetical protein